MSISRFEESIAWQKSRALTCNVYKIFGNHKDFGFKDQICRAVISVMNNIAEGFERKGNKEFKQLLFIAKGSAGEVRSMLYAANDVSYISDEEFNHLLFEVEEVARIIAGLIKSMT